MSHNFIKNDIKSIFSGIQVNISELENILAFKENSFILRHNIDAVIQFLKFLKSQENIFILNGFMGSGKTYVADIFTDFTDENVLVFKNSYQEAINLDDVLLSLFRDFSKYHNEKRIVLPKSETNIFSEKINAYIKYCNSPMLFIFDSFEINMRSRDTQKDILDFINYLSHFEKIKIVICSRSFKENDLISSEGCISHELKSITKEEMYDYIGYYNIAGSKYETEDFYKEIRGHYLLLELSVLIMNILGMSLTVFSSEYKKSAKNFLEFLISKILSLSSEKFVKILILLALIRHGLTREFIVSQKYATEEDIEYLLQKHIIAEKFGQYYLKDYVKNEYIKSISTETRINVHEYLIKIYDSELPLKPFERGLFLSRQTMRQEIAYHNNKIEVLKEELTKNSINKHSDMQDFNYLTYSKNSGYNRGMEASHQKRYIKNIQSKKTDKRVRFELSREDSLLLNASSSTLNGNEKEFKELVDIDNLEENYSKSQNNIDITDIDAVPESLEDYLNIAQKCEEAYNFSSAVLYYKKALTYKNDEMYDVKEPIIYTKLAICHKKLQDYEEAVRMYEKAYELYIKVSSEKSNSVLLSIAQIYSEVYKFDKVKETYNRILYSPLGVSKETVIRVYLDLSELEDNNLDIKSAVMHVQKALAEAEKLSDVKILSECYFRYALILDDAGNIDLAQKYYLRCIQTSGNPEENQFLSSAYSNLAGISLDNNNISAAKMYYEMASDIDKKMNNYDALYYSYSKLAELYGAENPEKRYECLVKALSAAKRFDDITYAVSVYIEIGEYYFDIENYKQSLKSYLFAKTLNPAGASDNLNKKVNTGINKIKIRLGDIEFFNLMNEIKKKK